jgi:hypothetical protein
VRQREHTNIERLAAFAYDALETLDEGARCAVFLLNIAVPVFLAGAEDHLFRVCGDGVE